MTSSSQGGGLQLGMIANFGQAANELLKLVSENQKPA